MTKTQAMDKIKELSKKLSASYKAGQVSTGDYTDAYNSLNDALVMLNNTKYPDLAMEEAAWVADMLDNLPKAEPAPASGNTTAGMTQDEYDKQKKAMYQKYKAGEITNYAYIQWKKQNNPANQAKSGAVSAPAAKKAQTPAATPQAAKTAAGGGMTQEQYEALKKVKYQQYKNGEITNYAYIQWKKQNDPSKQGGAQTAAAGAQAAKQAPAAPAASTAKQAAPAAAKPKGMTAEEYNELYDYLYTQKENGTITDSDLTDLIDFLNKAKDKGLSKDTTEYSLQIMVKNIAKNQAKTALPSFKLPDGPLDDNQKINYLQQLMALQKTGQVTGAEYNSFYDQIIAKNNEWHVNQAAKSPEMKNIESKLLKAFTHGDLTQAEVDKLTDMVNDMFDQGKSAADAEKTLDMAMQMTIDNGDTVEDAMAAAGYKPGKAGNHTITEDEMQKLIADVAKKYATGQITEKEYQALNKKLDDMWFTSGSKPTLAEAEAEIGISLTAPATGGMTDADYKKKADQLVKSATKGDISYKEYKDAIQALKEQAEQDGLEITVKGGKATVTPVPKTPMTSAEYDALMEQITESGNKALTGEDIKKIEKLAEIMSEGKLSAKEAAAAIGMSGTPIQASADTVSNAESPITEEQLKELKKQLKQKYTDGEINQDLFDDIGWELDSEAKSGKSLKEVEEIMHASVLNNYINGIAVEGTIEYEETDTLNDLVEKMLAAGYDEDDIKGKIDQIVEQSTDNGQPVEDAMADMGINPDNIPPKTKGGGMTDEQLKQIKTELAQKYTAGDITWDELNDIGAELNKLKAAGIGYNEAAIIAGAMADGDDLEKAALIAGVDLPESMKQAQYAVSDTEVHDLLDDLYKKVQKGTIKQEEYEALSNQAMQLQTENKSVDEIKAAIGLDPGTLAAEKAVDDLTDELKDVYGQAAKELKDEFDKFTDAFPAKMAQKQQDLQSGKITQAEYDAWVQNQLKTSELFQAKVDQMTDTLLHANQKAVAMINGETLGVFAENANFQAYQITKDAGVNLSFAIYDENTVKKLIKDKPELLPRKVVNGQKDKAWNQKQIAGAVTQAVLQGESIPKLAKRIATETTSTNMKAMVRYARTAMTGAQNAGRMEMLHQAKGMGIKVKKRWLATLDKRTRHTHARLDGTTIDIDEKFKTDYGELLFPGDPEGHPGDVYNCRCTLIYDYEGFPNDPADDQRLYYDEYTTTEVDAKGNTKKVKHREAHLITDMNYDEWKAAKEGSKLNELNIAKVTLAETQKAVLKAKISETKQYKDIWKDPVTLADYEAKKGAIQGKRDYYETEIQKYKDAIANGSSWATEDKLKELEKKLKALNEFEKNGKLLADRDKALKDVQDLYDAVGFQKTAGIPNLVTAQKKPKKAAAKTGGTSAGAAGQTAAGLSLGAAGEKKTQFAPDAWDAKTKKAARNFNSKGNADKVLRPELDAIWDNLTDEEKYGVWLYTWNSNPMNKPLSGHHDSWDRSRFIGYDKTVWGYEDNYSNRDISQCGEMGRFARRDGHAEYKKGIMYATNAIEKSTLQEGQWLVRGSDENGLAGWFAGAGMDFASVTDLFNGKYTEKDMQRALVGKKAINHAFTSTGIATGTGFGGNVKYKIYAPKGTKGIYAEPQSHYGDTTGDYYGSTAAKNRRDKIYKKGEKYKSVGDEAEIIIQRGTTYRCTGLKVIGTDWQGKPKIEIELEIVEQPDYFQYGDEDTYNNGKTRHKR